MDVINKDLQAELAEVVGDQTGRPLFLHAELRVGADKGRKRRAGRGTLTLLTEIFAKALDAALLVSDPIFAVPLGPVNHPVR